MVIDKKGRIIMKKKIVYKKTHMILKKKVVL